MARSGNRAGFWRSVRELPDRTPLRVKLITAVLALVLLALAVISFAGVAYIRGYLIDRADSQLEGLAASVEGRDYPFGGAGGYGPPVGEQRLVEAIFPDGSVARNGLDSGPPGTDPKIPAAASWLDSHAGKPIALSSESGDTWRILIQPGQMVTVGGPVGNQNVPATVVVGIDVTDVYATIARLEGFDILLSIGIVFILALLATAAVRASLRPLTDIEETAGAIAAGDLSERVPERDSRTEVGRLSRSLNVMLSQIESAFESRSRSEAAAKRSEERMRQFVADASHELRTPLTAIRGFAEYYRQRGGIAAGETAQAGTTEAGAATLADAAAIGRHSRAARPLAPADMDRIMRRVEQESARMGVLVEDMLLLARLDQQRPLTASPVDLLTLAADAVHDARVVAPARSINLNVNSSRALLVIGDEVRLRQVIGNLMTNAITHTPDGTPIDVLIRSGNLDEAAEATAVAGPDAAGPTWEDEPTADDWSATDDWPANDNWATAAGNMRWDADHVPPPPPPPQPAPDAPTAPAPAGRVLSGPAAVLEVTDYGPGLTAEQAEHVFERFYRADPARTTGGTGLGLAIVAALVAAHGGAAWVRTRRGEGATFCIALPLSPEATQAPENDFDPDTGELSAVDNSTGEDRSAGRSPSSDGTGPTEPGPQGPTEYAASETRSDEPRTARPATAYSASARRELGG
jgi:two-component system, OmpR family, sensor kinase